MHLLERSAPTAVGTGRLAAICMPPLPYPAMGLCYPMHESTAACFWSHDHACTVMFSVTTRWQWACGIVLSTALFGRVIMMY